LSRLFRSNFIRDVAIRNDVLLQQRENFKVNRMKKTGTGFFFFYQVICKTAEKQCCCGRKCELQNSPKWQSLSNNSHSVKEVLIRKKMENSS
jgi:hypothetical protein